MKEQLSLKRVLVDGTILSVLLTIVIYGSIYVNPAIWVGDYPPDIQAAVGDSIDAPPIQTIVAGLLFFGATIGMVLYSNGKLRQKNGGKLSFLAAFVNSALLLFYFAVWDLLVLDWLRVDAMGIRHRWWTAAGGFVNDQAGPNNEHSSRVST
jgi:hypothetical protein